MTRFPSWPTSNQGNIVGSRLSNEITHRFDGLMSVLSFVDQKDASLAELLATTGDTLNVKSFGAVGDGVVDDTASFQSAADALADGGSLVIPGDATYVISSPVEFSGKTGIRVIGQGGILSCVTTEATSDGEDGCALYFLNCTDFRVDGVRFAFNIPTDLTESCLLIKGGTNGRITNNVCDGANWAGIHIRSTQRFIVTGNVITNSGFPDFPDSTVGPGIYIATTSQNGTITGNTIFRCFHGIGTQDGGTVENVTIANNNIRNSVFSGVEIDDGTNIVVSGNTITNDNRYALPESIGIVVDSSDDVTIIGNTISEMYLYGVHFHTSSTRWTVSNNVISNTGTRGIFGNSTKGVISGNVVHDIYQLSLTISSVSGTFTADSVVEDATTGATATVKRVTATRLDLVTVVGTFTAANTVQLLGGGPPSATIDTVVYDGEGIALSAGAETVISGNSVATTLQHGIRAFDSSDVIISNNVVRDANMKDNAVGAGTAGGGSAYRLDSSGGPADRILVRGNKSVGTTHINGIILVNSNVEDAVLVGNDFSAFGTGSAIADSGTTTVLIDNIISFAATSLLRSGQGINNAGILLLSTVTTLANDATPSVAAGNLFKTGGTTTITDLDDGVVGQTITILSAHAITITDGTNILLNGSANFVMAAGDTLTLSMINDQVWEEVSRKVNL